MLVLAIPFGVAIGLAIGTLGGGGSVLAVPVLVYVLHQPVSKATTASLVVVTVAAVAGGLGHARAGRVCWRHAAAFTASALPGILAGTLLASVVSAKALLGAFALVMLAAAVATWRKVGSGRDDDDGREEAEACPPLRLPRDILAGVGVGFLTGFFGVGGGFLILPTLAVALAFTMRTAVGTSLAIIAGTSVIGLGVHLAGGRGLDVGVTAVLAGTCIAGALTGAALASRVPEQILGRGFAAMVFSIAVYLVVSVTVLGGPSGS